MCFHVHDLCNLGLKFTGIKLNDFKILCYMYNVNLLEQLLKNLHQSR